MTMFSTQFPIKRTNSRSHTTNTPWPNLFGPKRSFHFPPKSTSFNNLLSWNAPFCKEQSLTFSVPTSKNSKKQQNVQTTFLVSLYQIINSHEIVVCFKNSTSINFKDVFWEAALAKHFEEWVTKSVLICVLVNPNVPRSNSGWITAVRAQTLSQWEIVYLNRVRIRLDALEAYSIKTCTSKVPFRHSFLWQKISDWMSIVIFYVKYLQQMMRVKNWIPNFGEIHHFFCQ